MKQIIVIFLIILRFPLFAQYNSENKIVISEDSVTFEVDYEKIDVKERKPTVDEVRRVSGEYGVDLSDRSDDDIQDFIDKTPAMSLPDGTIYMNSDKKRRTSHEQKALLTHGIEHQSQYQSGKYGSREDVFQRLVEECVKHRMGIEDVYNTEGNLEYEAQQVENRAIKILKAKKNLKDK